MVIHPTSLLRLRVADFYFDDIEYKTAGLLIPRCNDQRIAIWTKRLPIFCIGNHDLMAAKLRIDLTRAEYCFISIAARYDHDFTQNIIINALIQ